MKARILLAGALMLLPGAALGADTRELVMARAARCAPISATREWLDCYYAAAQSMRVELGLAPAPQVARFDALFSAPAAAPVPALMIAPNAARLASAAAPPPHSYEAPAPIVGLMLGYSDKVPAAQFGLKGAKPGRGVNVDHITDQLAQYRVEDSGEVRVTLANGQVWRTREPGKSPFTRTPSFYTVTISNGAMNTFNLTIAGSREVYKVERLK